MKRILTLLVLSLSLLTQAQDTTFVQTFTYDSISTRRATFDFPASLETKSFEKVLMYYNLKCDPATPWDGYNCGEWDYLAYSRIFDHTGVMDSVKVEDSVYLINFNHPVNQNYDLVTGPFANHEQNFEQYKRSGATLINNTVLSGVESSPYPFNQGATGGQHYQMIVLASELTSAGIAPGNIQSLVIDGTAAMGSTRLTGSTIGYKFTTVTELTSFETGFTEVYNANRGANVNDDAALITGANEFLFYQPIVWNGTDNIVLEFEHANAGELNFEFNSNGNIGAGNLSIGYPRNNGVLNTTTSNQAMSELSNYDFGNEITISFWSKGNGSEGVNTSIVEANDSLNNRVFNLHFPWSNNQVYWDCGEGSGYDRINKAIVAGDIDNNWNHWAFTKNATTGDMKIYLNGVEWHSGTGMTSPIGDMSRMIIGANRSLANNWSGKIDEFRIWNKALDETTIASWMNKEVTNGHPDFANLVVYHNFDDVAYAKDASNNDYLLMPSEKGMFDFTELPVAGYEVSGYRPNISLGTGTVSGVMVTDTNYHYTQLEPSVFFEQQPDGHKFSIVNAFVGVDEQMRTHFEIDGTILTETQVGIAGTVNNANIFYHEPAFEIVNDLEIGRFITPYGIGFDLGNDGFTWIYDVTDYQQFLNGSVDFAAHNTQELIDVKFVFIEGTPPRDVHNIETVFGKWGSHTYNDLDNDIKLSAADIQLSDTSSNFKIKTRITGHGHNGATNCCEWDPKQHEIVINGTPRFNWSIWQDSECGDNPNIGQGGTWPYAREGWCPGDLVKDIDHELTPFVNPGEIVNIDYDVEDVPAGDPAQGNGNYVIATHLVSYGAPNHQNDAAIVDVLNPNNWEYYGKWNPTCSNPKVILQNTGAEELTSAVFFLWVSEGRGQYFEWTGSLNFLEKEIVEIPITDNGWWVDLTGENTFHIEIKSINGDDGLDEYANNNLFTTKFDAPESTNLPVFVWLRTNNKAAETSYQLLDHNGDVIFERDNMANSTDYRDTFDLETGCYSVVVKDSDSDGLGFWYSAQVEGETSGFLRIREVGGSYMEIFPTDFGNYHRYDFSRNFTVSLEEAEKLVSFDLYPNPTQGQFRIELAGAIGEADVVEIYNSIGELVLKQKANQTTNFLSANIDVTGIEKGLYIARIVTSQGVFTKEFVKN